MVVRGYWLGGGGFIKVIGGWYNLSAFPAPTDFIEYFTINFIQHFTIHVGAGKPVFIQ